MNKIEYDVQLPTWALCFLVNGDADDLSEDEINQVNRWQQTFFNEAKRVNGSVHFTPKEDEPQPYFCPFPAFGLAADAEDWKVVILYERNRRRYR